MIFNLFKVDPNIKNSFNKKPIEEALDLGIIDITEALAKITKDDLTEYENL